MQPTDAVSLLCSLSLPCVRRSVILREQDPQRRTRRPRCVLCLGGSARCVPERILDDLARREGRLADVLHGRVHGASSDQLNRGRGDVRHACDDVPRCVPRENNGDGGLMLCAHRVFACFGQCRLGPAPTATRSSASGCRSRSMVERKPLPNESGPAVAPAPDRLIGYGRRVG